MFGQQRCVYEDEGRRGLVVLLHARLGGLTCAVEYGFMQKGEALILPFFHPAGSNSGGHI